MDLPRDKHPKMCNQDLEDPECSSFEGYCGVGDQKGELCVLREKKISKQKGEMVAVSVT